MKEPLVGKSTNPKDSVGITKVPLSLVPGPALAIQAIAHLIGAVKYGKYNWREKGVSAQVYIDACLRHVHSWYDGENDDEESGISHLGHAIACLNIILDAEIGGSLVDDRPARQDTSFLLNGLRPKVKDILEHAQGETLSG